jgi:LuxR family maltose regulon positive regulatory protein
MKSPRPFTRPGLVLRSDLIDRLEKSTAPVVAVVAPAGFGKTSLLCQWADISRRPLVWLNLDATDDDPAVLSSNLAHTLRGLVSDHALVSEGKLGTDGSSPETAHADLESTISSITSPFVLVVDPLDTLRNKDSVDLLAALCLHVPDQATVALAGRSEAQIPLGRFRAEGRVLEIGREDLAMAPNEAAEILAVEGADVGSAAIYDVWNRTEGWPVALYLAAQSAVERKDDRGGLDGFRGDDRLMTDYVRSEVLPRLTRPEVNFMMRTSVLESMSGPMCDSVLGRKSSARVLEALEAANALVIPLDRSRSWYRYHPMLRDLLRAEQYRRDPEGVVEVLRRAAVWCEANGEAEAAVGYAELAGDVDRVAALAVKHWLTVYQAGHAATVESWLDWLLDHDAALDHPQVAELAAWVYAIRGRPAEAERWLGAAETWSEASTDLLTLPLLSALLCRRGVDRMRADAELGLRTLPPGSPWQPTATLLLAIALLLAGEPEQADALFADAADEGGRRGPVYTIVLAVAYRAVIAISHGDWDAAGRHADRATAAICRLGLEENLSSGLAYAVSARVALERGEADEAKEHLARARRLRPLLSHGVPHLSVQTLLELAQAHMAVADAQGTRILLREAEDVLQRRQDLGGLSTSLAALRHQVESMRLAAPGASTLTAAELRLLPFLATHLSFREIGEKLYVSANTVRTQAGSVYRKLIVTSRSEAIERAREFGLLPA